MRLRKTWKFTAQVMVYAFSPITYLFRCILMTATTNNRLCSQSAIKAADVMIAVSVTTLPGSWSLNSNWSAVESKANSLASEYFERYLTSQSIRAWNGLLGRSITAVLAAAKYLPTISVWIDGQWRNTIVTHVTKTCTVDLLKLNWNVSATVARCWCRILTGFSFNSLWRFYNYFSSILPV